MAIGTVPSTSSWPGSSPSKTGVNALMSRPSMSLSLEQCEDVDARDRRGHDERRV
jgi:hypothetical protein